MAGGRNNAYEQYGHIAWDMYVAQRMTVAEIVAKVPVGKSSIDRWRHKHNWDADREIYSGGTTGLMIDLDRLMPKIRERLESPILERNIEAVEILDKITRIKARINSASEREAVTLDVLFEFARYARANCPPAIKGEVKLLTQGFVDMMHARSRKEVV